MQTEANSSNDPALREGQNNPQFQTALRKNNRIVQIRTGKVACWLVILLMPLGATLDFFACPDRMWQFLLLRVLCSVLVFGLLLLHGTQFAERHYPAVGLPIVLLPAFFITVMIHIGGEELSTYYAGLNLIMLAVSAVGHWNIRESLTAVGSVIAMYMLVSFPELGDALHFKVFYNNVYFLALTGIIVVCGNFVFNMVRFREFQANYALELSRRELQDTLVELRRAQEQLVEQKKAELLGQVSQNLVHDVGNLMQPVGNYLFKLKGMGVHLPETKRASFAETLAKIERPMSAARGVLATLQRYAHGAPQMTHECSVSEVVEDALHLVRATAEEAGVTLNSQVDRQFVVLGQPLDLTMVFKNLLDNAITATKVKTYVDEKPAIWIESRLEAGRGYLVVRDNGVGIDPEGLTRIFTRYYSTKRDGNGTGLGLVGCKASIEKLGGAISVRSEVGKFTEITVELPRPTIGGSNPSAQNI